MSALWGRFIGEGRSRKVAAKELLWDQGQEIPGLYLVETGLVGLYRDRVDHKCPVGLVGPGEWVLDPALLDGQPASRQAEVWQEAHLLFWDAGTWQGYARSPEVLRQLLVFLAKQMRQQQEHILVQSYGSAKERFEYMADWLQGAAVSEPLSFRRISRLAGVSAPKYYTRKQKVFEHQSHGQVREFHHASSGS
jgi:CRP-like cAMP-binding protein